MSTSKKWRMTLLLGVVLNLYFNFNLRNRIIDLEIENLKLKQTNTELLSSSFSGQKILDDMPFSFWRKKKNGEHYVMKFINQAGKDQFLESKGINRYYYHNKTDFAVFNFEDAYKFYKEDSLVAHAKTDTIAHFNTDFFDAKGNKLIKDGYTRWRKIIDNDTMIFGKMDKYYKKAK